VIKKFRSSGRIYAITRIPSEKILMGEFSINFPPDIVQLKPKIIEKSNNKLI
jgi:hypothetical protein